MKNYDVVVANEDVPTKKYVDDLIVNEVVVNAAEPTNPAVELWLDLDDTPATSEQALLERIAALEARMDELERAR